MQAEQVVSMVVKSENQYLDWVQEVILSFIGQTQLMKIGRDKF
jgi:hypothetical protein